MENIKKKMNAMREQLEAAEEKYTACEKKFSQSNELADRLEEDAISLKRQIYLQGKELDNIDDQYDQKRDRLLEYEDIIECNRRCIKVLDEQAAEDEARIEKLELYLKEMREQADEKETRYREISSKLGTTTYEYDRACLRLQRAEANTKMLFQEYGLKARNAKVLEDKEDRLAEREDSLEKKQRELDVNIKEMDMRAESAERTGRSLGKAVETLKNNIEELREKTRKMQKDRENILYDLEAM